MCSSVASTDELSRIAVDYSVCVPSSYLCPGCNTKLSLGSLADRVMLICWVTLSETDGMVLPNYKLNNGLRKQTRRSVSRNLPGTDSLVQLNDLKVWRSDTCWGREGLFYCASGLIVVYLMPLDGH